MLYTVDAFTETTDRSFRCDFNDLRGARRYARYVLSADPAVHAVYIVDETDALIYWSCQPTDSDDFTNLDR